MSAQVLGERESRRIRDLARQYRRDGYRVVVNPSSSDLPEFLQDFQPDMIAESADDSVVIEVKSKEGLPAAKDLSLLAARVNEQANWRFELVVTNPRDSQEPSGRLIDAADIWRRLNSINDLSRHGHTEAAFLLLWSSTEAVLRMIADREGVKVGRLAPVAIVKELSTLGLIGRSDYRALEGAARARDAMVHGFRPEKFRPALIKQVSDVTERLLEEVAAH